MVGSGSGITLAPYRPRVRGHDDLRRDSSRDRPAHPRQHRSDNATTRHTTTTRTTLTTAQILAGQQITRKNSTPPVDDHSACGQPLPLTQALQPDPACRSNPSEIGLDGLAHRLLQKLAHLASG